MMISLVKGIDTILVVFMYKRICLSTTVTISLSSRSVADVITVEPHIPGNKKELP
jgi:hypothetical protein